MTSVTVHVYAYDKKIAPKVTMSRLPAPSSETVTLEIETERSRVQFFLSGKDSLEAMTEALDNAVRAFFLSEANP